MEVKTSIIEELSQQYQATLKMVGDVIVNCKDELWKDYIQEIVISQLVYHILSSADLFLAKVNNEESSFKSKYGNHSPSFNEADKILTKKQLESLISSTLMNLLKNYSLTSLLLIHVLVF